MMSPADEVWNRACAEAGGPKMLTASGDRALADMVLAHSLAMNGGVLHAVESLTEEELVAALEGYSYFGLEAVASVLRDIAASASGASLGDDAADSLESEADERYAAVVADDDVLIGAFEGRYHADPSAFDPVR